MVAARRGRRTEPGHRTAVGTTDPGPNIDTASVVVGVDGSEPSRAALFCAAQEAQLRQLPLEVVMTWHEPIDPDVAWPSSAELASDTRRALVEIVRSVLGDDPAVEVRATAVSGQAGHVLCERSGHAALVVVGSRGHGEVAGLLLGSVSEFLAAHARCPVLIVRGAIAGLAPRSTTSPTREGPIPVARKVEPTATEGARGRIHRHRSRAARGTDV